jgi:hypothetical protein
MFLEMVACQCTRTAAVGIKAPFGQLETQAGGRNAFRPVVFRSHARPGLGTKQNGKIQQIEATGRQRSEYSRSET